MSNLSRRVEKAKGLTYSHSPYRPGHWATWGSRDSKYGQKYYRVALACQIETIPTPDGKKNISVFMADCQKDTGNGQPCNCPGNERHTVCYHSLGAIYRSFEQAKVKRLVSFFETYEAASRMSFGGKVAKVKSANGPGIVWCVVKDWPEKKSDFQFQVNIIKNLLKKGSLNIPSATGTGKTSGRGKVLLSAQENISLMRGDKDDEGID